MPVIEELPRIHQDVRLDENSHTDSPYVVILYNDDYHGMDEVVLQLQKATGCSIEQAALVMLEAHTLGRAVAHTGSQDECERAASVLRQIRLQVETDRA